MMVVLVSGNPFDGLTVHGPFANSEDAGMWAERQHSLSDSPWSVVEVKPADAHRDMEDETITLHELLDDLDGRGMVIEDWEPIEKRLYELGIGNDAPIGVKQS